MNKTAIKSFAIEARKKLIASVKDKAGLLGITKDGCSEPEQKGDGFEVYRTHAGTENKIYDREIRQRKSLVSRIKEKGYDNVTEEVAYTWFNRIIAIRFMEVNDYLPTRVRVLSSETENKMEPDIVTQAPDIDLNLTDSDKAMIYSLKVENKLDELFGMLFIKQCNKLGEILPELFEKVADYTELLLNVSYINQDGVIRMLVDTLEEEDFKEAVEIIGWMYQYYNAELKDDTFALLKKNVKITKERIPAATQLFTPDWIVRYMVENSLGRLWLEHLQAENKSENEDKMASLKSDWKYYLEEAEQQEEVKLQLNQLREGYKNLNPEEIKIIDPCMGSGHILVYAFDVLKEIYGWCGYSERDSAKLIVQKNLYGLEIDDRAYQLAYFAVMMKGRKCDRRFLTRGIEPNLCSIQESHVLGAFEHGAGQLKLNDLYKETANYLISEFRDAKEYGSILNIEQRDYDGLLSYVEELNQKGADDLLISGWLRNISELLPRLIKQAKIMAQKYDVVVTNPPYMGSSGMNVGLSNYVKKNYPDSKADLFAVFIEKCGDMLKKNGLQAMITQHAWMFLSSFEKLREKLLYKDIINMVHLGARAFEEIGGEVVQTTAFVVGKYNINGYKASFVRLIDYNNQSEKERAFISKQRVYFSQKQSFSKLPGRPMAYWISKKFIEAFDMTSVGDSFIPKFGMSTGDGERFIRNWYECEIQKIEFECKNEKDYITVNKNWALLDKGGTFKRWYGNRNNVVWWKNNGLDIKQHKKSAVRSPQYFFKPHISWTLIASGKFSARFFENGFVLDTASNCIYLKRDVDWKVLAFLNSKIATEMLNVLNPTLNFSCGIISLLPYKNFNNEYIDDYVKQNISFSKNDWDSFEISWDFKHHPLLINNTEINLISDAFKGWKQLTEKQFNELKTNEEELNRIFIEIYGLQDELTPEVDDKDVTIRKADLSRDIRSFISYAVGCMFGRYSIDVDGLAYAGGSWEDAVNSVKYKTLIPACDNVIPITDEEYFEDDIVGLFVKFVKTVYGEETLEENLDFIAKALGNKGVSSREVIRNYFVKDFYKDHLKVYQKRPIYWQFDSGKQDGFKALIYMHRYDRDTVGRVRVDYLHKTQAAIENAIKSAEYIIETTSNNAEKSKATKAKEKYVKQLAETRTYDEAMAYIAHQRIDIDLDDGVKVNYEKFQGIEISSQGKKTQKIDLLAKI